MKKAAKRASIPPIESAHVVLKMRGRQLAPAASRIRRPRSRHSASLGGSAPGRHAHLASPTPPDRAERRGEREPSAFRPPHGGQLAGVNQLVTFFNDGFLAGGYHAGDATLYVSPDSDLWTGFPCACSCLRKSRRSRYATSAVCHKSGGGFRPEYAEKSHTSPCHFPSFAK